MKIKCEGDVDYLIFLQELKTMLMIAKTDDDLELLLRVVEKYCSQTNIITFTTFSPGPELMRLFYILNKPKEALELVKNPKTTNIFNETVSYSILADLLFKNKMYEEGIDFFYFIKSKQLKGFQYPPMIINFFFAFCCKLNSREMFEEATKFVQLFEKINLKISVRAKCFYSALALHQKDLESALKILDPIKSISSPVINLKVLILTEKKDFNNLFKLLNEMLSNKSELNSLSIDNLFISSDVLQCIEKALLESNGKNLKVFEKIKENLDSMEMISEEPWEINLFKTIEFKKKNWPK